MSTIVNDSNTRNNDDIRTNQRLKFLDDISGYKVHHDDIDPRGYTVKLSSGESIGEVEGLLADTTAKLVRYVEVEIDDDLINRHERGLYNDDDRHALIPVGLIHIDKSSRSVVVSGITYDRLVDYPRARRDRGYSTGYEIDTNNYLSGFHEYGNSYDTDRYGAESYRNADRLDDEFYTSDFYASRSSRNKM